MILTVTWILRNIYQFQQIKSNPTHDAWLKVVSSQKVQNPIIILRLSTARTRDKSSLPLSGSVGRNVDDVDGKVVHTQRLEEILGLGVDLERRLLGSSKGRDLGDVLVLSLPLLFLQPERDTSAKTPYIEFSLVRPPLPDQPITTFANHPEPCPKAPAS